MPRKKSRVFKSAYKGHPILEIWPVDESGREGKYKTIAFGVKKAKAILENIEEIQRFVEENDKQQSTPDRTPIVPEDVKDVF